MKRLFLATLFSTISISLFYSQPKYGSIIGEITNNSIVKIDEYFDDYENIRLEIYVMNMEGSVNVVLFDPSNTMIKTFPISNGLINSFQEKIVSIKGKYKAIIIPNNGKGMYIVKIHNKNYYFGLTEDDKKILSNSFIWLLQ